MSDITYNVKRDNTVRKERYITVIRNPYVNYYSSKVIFGGSVEIVDRKVQKQLEKWRADCEKAE